jgi:hypothetical protein
MLKENRFTRYTLYAIGEIILVVIGILFAVSINTWNTQRKIKADNEIYLNKILEELEMNKTRLDMLSIDHENGRALHTVVANCDSLQRLMAKGLGEEDVDFILNAEIYSGSNQLNLNDQTYEELMNTGKLYTLGSDSLLTAIKSYYKRYEREVVYNRVWNDHLINGLDLMSPSYYKMKRDHRLNPKTFDLNNYLWYFDQKSQEYLDLESAIARLLAIQSLDLRKCRALHEDTDALIEVIAYELETKYAK